MNREKHPSFAGGFIDKYSSRLMLIAVLLIMIFFLGASSRFFLTWRNMKNILNLSSTYLLLSVGMTFVICSGGIDLSVGSVMAMSAMIMGLSMKAGIPCALSVGLGLLTGILIGVANGLIIAAIKMNALIATLCMMSVVRGAVLLLTGAKPVYGFCPSFTYWGSSVSIFENSVSVGGVAALITPPITLTLIVTVTGLILLNRTKFGRYCLVLGDNESSLRQCGVDTGKYKVLIYAVSGFCAALAGFIVAARLNACEPNAGTGYEMDAIAAVVLGGTLIQGGKGSIVGTFIASMILAVMTNGLTMLGVSSNYQQLFTGIIVMVTVAVSEIKKRKNREVS